MQNQPEACTSDLGDSSHITCYKGKRLVANVVLLVTASNEVMFRPLSVRLSVCL